MLRIEAGRPGCWLRCGSYSETGRSVVVGRVPRSGDVSSGDGVMVVFVLGVGRVGDDLLVDDCGCDCEIAMVQIGVWLFPKFEKEISMND